MTKKVINTEVYGESDATKPASDQRPIPAPGIGRRISDVAALLGTRRSAHSVMGVSSAALQRYIKGQNMPPFDAVARLCIEAGVRMEWLATGEGEMREAGPKPAPRQASHPVRRADQTMGLGMLTKAVRLVGDALDKYQLRDQVDAQTFADLVEDTFRELQLGKAEDIVHEMLDRIVGIARNPRQD